MDTRLRTSAGPTREQIASVPDLTVSSSRSSPAVGRLALAVDAVALIGAAVLTWTPSRSGWLVWAYAGLAFVAMHVVAPRRGRLEATVAKDAGWIVQRMATPLLVLVPLAGGQASRLAEPVATAVVTVFAARVVAFALLRFARARGIVSEPCLIVGAGDVGRRLATVLLEHPEFGLVPVGFLDGTTRTDLMLPVLGEGEDLGLVARGLGIRTALIADGDLAEAEIIRSIRANEDRRLDLYVVPRLSDIGAVPRESERLWGVHLTHVDRAIFHGVPRLSKRALDLVVATIALVAFSPVLLVAALATRVSSPGQILFRQKRVGIGGVPFEMLKFRTMEESDDSETTWSVSGDARVTKVGRILRRTSVDELPQLFNVLRGEMSLVGPRPERPHFVEGFSAKVPGYSDRHRVAGGMTGLAQVHGRSRKIDSIPERAHFDNNYIDNWSLWGDVVILVRTARLLFRGDQEVGVGDAQPDSADDRSADSWEPVPGSAPQKRLGNGDR